MRSSRCLPLLWLPLLACGEGTTRPPSDDPADTADPADPGSDDVNVNPSAGPSRFAGPCQQLRDDNLDGTPETIVTHTYQNNRLSVTEVDSGGDGTIDERRTHTYENDRPLTRNDVNAAGAVVRVVTWHYDAEGLISHTDVDNGGDGTVDGRTRHMYLASAGLTCSNCTAGNRALLRWDDDAMADGTSESHVLLGYHADGHTARWTAYNLGAISWIQRAVSRDAAGNTLLLEIDMAGDGTTNARIVQTYDCWSQPASSASFIAPAPTQSLLLQTTVEVPDTASGSGAPDSAPRGR
jgi:hypothetical protein